MGVLHIHPGLAGSQSLDAELGHNSKGSAALLEAIQVLGPGLQEPGDAAKGFDNILPCG